MKQWWMGGLGEVLEKKGGYLVYWKRLASKMLLSDQESQSYWFQRYYGFQAMNNFE